MCTYGFTHLLSHYGGTMVSDSGAMGLESSVMHYNNGAMGFDS